MRTTIKAIENNHVEISFVDMVDGTVVNMTIKAPIDGGYVRDQHGRQVCDNLDGMGNTLLWDGKTPLVNLVRKEYRKMRYADNRTLKSI